MKLEWNTCLKVGVSIFLLYLCINYWTVAANFVLLILGAAMPLIVGGVIAYLVNILMSFYERHYFVNSKSDKMLKSRRPVCMLLAFSTLLVVVFLIVGLVVPQLFSSMKLILAEMPGIMTEIVTWIEKLHVLPENIMASLTHIDWQSKIGQIIQILTSGIGNVVDVLVKTISSVFSWVVSALLSMIFAIYLLAGKENLKRQFHKLTRRYLKESWNKRLNYGLNLLDDCFHRYIVGQCTEAVIIGVLCTLGMLVLRLPYATMIGALVGFTALIPVAGAYIGAIIGAFMIFTESPIKAVVFLIFLVVLQQVEGNIIYPKVVGSSIGLPGIWVLAAVTIGGGVLGVSGMLLGVPLAAAAYRLIREDVNRLQDDETENQTRKAETDDI